MSLTSIRRRIIAANSMRVLGASLLMVAMTISLPVPATAVTPALDAYVSQPFVQGPSSPGAEIETFDTSCPSTWWLSFSNNGSRTGPCSSQSGNIWGGASTTSGTPTKTDPSHQTKYGMISRGQTLTIQLTSPASYVGFNWQAGDPCNTLTISNGGTTLTTFTTEDLMGMIYSGSIGSWSSNDYLINPARSQWVGQPFAFIHLVGVHGLTFDKLTFTQTCSGGFEFDNFTIIDAPVTLDPTTVVAITDTTPPDADADGVSDFEEDEDGDGISNPFEDTNDDGVADSLQDSDGDGINDYVEAIRALANTGVPTSGGLLLGLGLFAAGLTLVIARRRFRGKLVSSVSQSVHR